MTVINGMMMSSRPPVPPRTFGEACAVVATVAHAAGLHAVDAEALAARVDPRLTDVAHREERIDPGLWEKILTAAAEAVSFDGDVRRFAQGLSIETLKSIRRAMIDPELSPTNLEVHALFPLSKIGHRMRAIEAVADRLPVDDLTIERELATTGMFGAWEGETLEPFKITATVRSDRAQRAMEAAALGPGAGPVEFKDGFVLRATAEDLSQYQRAERIVRLPEAPRRVELESIVRRAEEAGFSALVLLREASQDPSDRLLRIIGYFDRTPPPEAMRIFPSVR